MPDSIAHISHTAPTPAASQRPEQASASAKAAAPPARLTRQQADSLARVKAIADSTAHADSVKTASSLTKAIIVVPGKQAESRPPAQEALQSSWVIAVLALLFCLFGLRYRGNARFLKGLLKQAVEIRKRNNMFDETVRESLVSMLMNLLTAGSIGLLLSRLLEWQGQGFDTAAHMGVCIGCAVGYTLVVPGCQLIFGSVFAGRQTAMEWVKGFSAGMALLAIPLFPIALVALCSPSLAKAALVVAAICFTLAKLVYIYRAFRIFMTESSSWVVFLYYLCNLEIIPIIITYVGACGICAIIS